MSRQDTRAAVHPSSLPAKFDQARVEAVSLERLDKDVNVGGLIRFTKPLQPEYRPLDSKYPYP